MSNGIFYFGLLILSFGLKNTKEVIIMSMVL